MLKLSSVLGAVYEEEAFCGILVILRSLFLPGAARDTVLSSKSLSLSV